MSRSLRGALAGALLLTFTGAGQAQAAITPPGQPTSGPGSSAYSNTGTPFVSGLGGVGGYTVYEPNPRPASPAPVVVVIHGNCVTAIICQVNNVSAVVKLGALMTHLAKKGNVVIFPRYQSASNTPAPTVQVQTAINGVSGALNYLETTPGRTLPDRTRFGIWGHSRGGWIGTNMSALLVGQGLPHPDYMVAMAPGEDTESGIPKGNWATIPSDMKLLAVVAQDDTLAGEGEARYGAGKIFNETTTIGLADKDYVRVNTDTYGSPDLIADHSFVDDSPVNALDYFVAWKFPDAMRDCTGFGTNCSYALGGGANQENVGNWSNGTAVKKLCVTDNTAETWTQSCAH